MTRALSRDYPPAVVIGLGVTGLGIVRSLSQSSLPIRVPIHGIDSNLSQPAARTRLCRKYYCEDLGSERLIEYLIGLGRKFGHKPPLFLSKDTTVLTVSRNRKELGPYYRFVLPEIETVDLLMDKTLFSAYAQENGFCVPYTAVLDTKDDLLRVSDQIRFPCVLKPCYRTERWQKSGHPKGFYLTDRRALIEAYDGVCSAQQRFVLQEWVEGPDSELYFCLVFFDEDSRCLGSFTGRKRRQWPCGVGNTSMAEPVDCPEIEKETIRLFETVRFKGFGSVEFKRDSMDGRYKIMEPTVGRANLQSEVATANGVNLPWLAYGYLTGMKPERQRLPKRPVRWINEYNDLKSCLYQIRRRQLSFREWVQSYRGSKHYALFSWKDPMPLLATIGRLFWRGVCRTVFKPFLRDDRSRTDEGPV